MTIKEMTMDQVNERIAEIRTAIDAPDADLDALNAEIDELEARKAEIEKSAEQRKALRAKVITTGATVRTFGEDQKEDHAAVVPRVQGQQGSSGKGEAADYQRGA